MTSNIEVEAIYHSEGRLTPNGSGYRYEYTLKDHLGNARVSFADIDNDGSVDQSEVLQTNHYYPFGMRHEGKDLPQQGVTNAYQYNGKELNADFGLDWLDYGARWYDASIARWSAVDPLAETMASWSPYNYAFNNPIKFVDPDGRMPKYAQDMQNAINYSQNAGNRADRRKKEKATAGANKAISKHNTQVILDAVGDDMDFLYDEGKKDKIEYSATIAQNEDGDIYLTNINSGVGQHANADYNLKEGETLLGAFHTHNYSNKDIEEIKEKCDCDFDGTGVPHSITDMLGVFPLKFEGTQNFTQFVHSGSEIFALSVIDEVAATEYTLQQTGNKYQWESFSNLTMIHGIGTKMSRDKNGKLYVQSGDATGTGSFSERTLHVSRLYVNNPRVENTGLIIYKTVENNDKRVLQEIK